MAFIARQIKDRIAVDDNCFYMEQLGDGRIRLVPAPTEIIEPGTDVNKALLQPIENNTVWLMNRLFDNITSNPLSLQFGVLDGAAVTGIWNQALKRIEC
jgi:hypothetical protein